MDVESKEYLLKREKSGLVYTPAKIITNPESLTTLANPTRLKILKLLSKTPLYPAEIAKKLGLHEQKTYYHIKQLKNAGLITITETKNIRGTTAKRFKAAYTSFGVTVKPEWKQVEEIMQKTLGDKLTNFLNPFIEDGKLNGNIVLGSADPHGQYKQRARDGYLSTELGLFLGQYAKLPKKLVVRLDTHLMRIKEPKKNLILLGGPASNLVTDKFNNKLRIKYGKPGQPWSIKTVKGKYHDADIGVIQKVPNPYDPSKTIIAIGGIRMTGTIAAVRALTRHT
ncbi:MAG: helix-turn-helix domain-containing protein, partial [Candidatus Diapherotrites archaeon]|nr:helix-turn-helix domain-containing protein [Candidatus Diapherotrites archaeon]